MSQNFQDFTSHSDRDLEKCVRLRAKYAPEDVESAVFELERRGRIFSLAEITAIEKDIRKMRRELSQEESTVIQEVKEEKPSDLTSPRSIPKESYPANAIDSELPSYYSPLAVSVFSVLFGTIFGVVLMAINFYKINNKKALWEVILFGVLYILIGTKIMSYVPPKEILTSGSIATLILNVCGAAILYLFFWRRYIGDSKLYKSRPFIQMLLISLIVVFAFVGLLMSGGAHKL